MADEVIRDRLKEALAYRNMTPAELSRKTGLSRASISRYLNLENSPKQNAIGMMASAMKVNPAWLLGYDVEMIGDIIRPDMVIENQDDTLIVEFKKLNSANQEAVKKYIEFLIKSQEE